VGAGEGVHSFGTAPGSLGSRYGESCYGCFVRDLDDQKIDAAYWSNAFRIFAQWRGELTLTSKLTGAPCSLRRAP
jgi:hypothetical protein